MSSQPPKELELLLDESEGYAFLRQREPEADDPNPLPRLVQRRVAIPQQIGPPNRFVRLDPVKQPLHPCRDPCVVFRHRIMNAHKRPPDLLRQRPAGRKTQNSAGHHMFGFAFFKYANVLLQQIAHRP